MKVIINGTNEIKQLTCIDPTTGIDSSDDIVGNSGAIGDYILWDECESAYRIDEDDYSWWKEYLGYVVEDSETLQCLKDEFGAEEVSEIYVSEIIKAGHIDYEDEHRRNLDIFETIRAELGEEKEDD